jgi:hypothetical protein
MRISSRLKLRAALLASVSTRSVENFFAGRPQLETTSERIAAALRELGHPELATSHDINPPPRAA